MFRYRLSALPNQVGKPEKTPWFLQWTHSLLTAFVALFSTWLIGGLEVSEPNLWLTILGLVVPQTVMLVGSQYIKQKTGLVGGAAASAVVGVARRLMLSFVAGAMLFNWILMTLGAAWWTLCITASVAVLLTLGFERSAHLVQPGLDCRYQQTIGDPPDDERGEDGHGGEQGRADPPKANSRLARRNCRPSKCRPLPKRATSLRSSCSAVIDSRRVRGLVE